MHLLMVGREYVIGVREGLKMRSWELAAEEHSPDDDGAGSITGLKACEMPKESIPVEMGEGVRCRVGE